MLCTAWPAHVAWCLAFSNLIFKTPPTYSLIELSLNDLDEKGTMITLTNLFTKPMMITWCFRECSGFFFFVVFFSSYTHFLYQMIPDVVPGTLLFYVLNIDLIKDSIACLFLAFWVFLVPFTSLSSGSVNKTLRQHQSHLFFRRIICFLRCLIHSARVLFI